LSVSEKPTEAMQVSLLPLGDAQDGESAAIRNRFAIVWQPDQAGMVAVIIDLQCDAHLAMINLNKPGDRRNVFQNPVTDGTFSAFRRVRPKPIYGSYWSGPKIVDRVLNVL